MKGDVMPEKLTKRKAKKKAKMEFVPTFVKPIKEFIKRNPRMFKYMGGTLKK